MQPLRVRVQLGWTPSGQYAAKFWWQPAPEALTVGDVLEEVGAHLGLKPVQRSGLVATMDGFAVLSSSKTEVLRDGDTLLVSQGRKRGAADAFAAAADEGLPPTKKRGTGTSSSGSEQEEERGGTSSSEPSSSSSEEEEAADASSESASSSSSEDSEDSASSSSDGEDSEGAGKAAAGTKSLGFQTPADNATPGTASKKPSRSARRKAAKRRLRRMGVLPQGNCQPAAAAAAARTATAADKDVVMNGGAGPADKPQDASPMQAGGSKQSGRSAAAAAAFQGQRQGKAAEASQEQQGKQPAPSAAAAPNAAAPEVAVPPEWQQLRGAAQHPRQAKQQGDQQQQQSAATPAAGAGVQQPMADAEFAQLPLLTGGALVGDVLAYKLLEIGLGMEPVVSEVRCGRVIALEGDTLTLEPHPDPSLHPLSHQRALRLAKRQAEADWWEQEDVNDGHAPDLGAYDEAGGLTAELSSFVELRVLQQAAKARRTAGVPLPAAPVAPGSIAAAGGSVPGEAADVGPSSYSQLGPPQPTASTGDVIAPEGGWASLYEQLARRRAQLSAGAAAGASTPHAPPKPSGAPTVESSPPAAAGSRGQDGIAAGRSSSVTPGATRPRAGVRRSALGPMLRILRDSQEL